RQRQGAGLPDGVLACELRGGSGRAAPGARVRPRPADEPLRLVCPGASRARLASVQARRWDARNLPARKAYTFPEAVELGRQSGTTAAATASGAGSVIGSSPGATAARIRVRVWPGMNMFTRMPVDAVSAA